MRDTYPAIARARRLLKWIAEDQLSEFTRRDAFNRVRSAGDRVDLVDVPLAVLVEHNYIHECSTDRDGPGRKPSTTYFVNPIAVTQNAHNAQNRSGQDNSAENAPEEPQ